MDTFVTQAPEIIASDVTIALGSVFDLSKVASIVDDCEDDMVLEVLSGQVETDIAGVYPLELRAVDSFGEETLKTINVTVVLNKAPVLIAKDVVIYVGERFNALDHVSATDDHDKDLTIEVVKDKVRIDETGEYEVTYRVIDSFGEEVTQTIKVTVKEKEVESKPEKEEDEDIQAQKPQSPSEEQPEKEEEPLKEEMEQEDDKKPTNEKPITTPTGISSLGVFTLGGCLIVAGQQLLRRKDEK